MNRKEREQMIVFEKLLKKEITGKNAGQMLSMTSQWIRKKLKRYRLSGAQGLVHGNRGKPSKRRSNEVNRTLLVSLLKDLWKGFGPTFAMEKLFEIYKIKLSHETVRKIMIEEKLWRPNQKNKSYRKLRERKDLLGQMIQLDGSEHLWFEERAPACTLLVFIDDATSKIMHLEFVTGESFLCVAGSTMTYLITQGRPLSFYVDNASVFKVNINNFEGLKKTQLGRALEELGIELVFARSPQAKGRVERAHQTLQDRLIKDLRLQNISSQEEANHFLKGTDWLEKHNAKFSVPALTQGNAHRSYEGYDLYTILSRQENRVLCNDYTLSYYSHVLQLEKHQPLIVRPKDVIRVYEHLDKRVSLRLRGKILLYKDIGLKKRGKLNPIDQVNQERMTGEIVPLKSKRETNYVAEKRN